MLWFYNRVLIYTYNMPDREVTLQEAEDFIRPAIGRSKLQEPFS